MSEMSIYVDIKKSFNGFNLDVKFQSDDEIFALLGASGCGKSLTLKCIAGIEKPDKGRIILDGITVFDSEKKINLSPQKRGVGYLFQNYALFPNMTVLQNITATKEWNKGGSFEEISRIIKMFHLDGLEGRYPSQLSGGQQQRVALARILASKPKILMLDEPFSALDSYLRWQLEQEMSVVLKKFKGTTLYVSHNRDEVYRLCDRICVLSNGSVDIVDEKWWLFKNPQTYSASLLTGCKNISEIEIINDKEIYAKAWGLTFLLDKNISKTTKFVGVRGHLIKPCKNLDLANSFEYEIIKEFEDTFSIILMIRPKNLKFGDGLIRWEISKKTKEKLKCYPPFAYIVLQDIMLLR